jgi:hypothetical protein
MSKLNVPMFLLTGVPLTEGESSGCVDWVDILVFGFFFLLLVLMVGLLIVGIVSAFMWQPM